MRTSEFKDFRKVDPKYDQDYINGVGDLEYKALFDKLKTLNVKTILDLGGGVQVNFL